MSTPNTEVAGIQVAGGVAVHVPGVDVLAFTGTGPGTLPLAIVGLVTLIAGWFAVAFGKRRAAEPSGGDASPLRDLSHLASGAIR